MRMVAGGLLVAIALFVGAAVCWSEARLARRVADAHQRLATLHYDTVDGINEASIVSTRLPWAMGSLGADIGRHRAIVSYWQARYPDLTAALPGNSAQATSDPEIMFVAANAAFRASQADTSDRSATIDRLDRVIGAYAEVLRRAPENTDASFNYEYVAKFRDGFARSKPPAREARSQKRPPEPEPAEGSIDLPPGPTVHGHPGGPPPDEGMEKFRTLTPMKFDEREEGEAGRGSPPRRKG